MASQIIDDRETCDDITIIPDAAVLPAESSSAINNLQDDESDTVIVLSDSEDDLNVKFKDLECEKCKLCLKSERALKFNERSYTGGMGFQCVYCGDCYSHACVLLEHQYTHNVSDFVEEVSTENCEECQYLLSLDPNFMSNQRYYIGGGIAYQCLDCATCFTHVCSLNRHLLSHFSDSENVNIYNVLVN